METITRAALIKKSRLMLGTLAAFDKRPEPFAPGAPFWNDPYIATSMLDTHLDPDVDAASHPPAIIDAEVEWLVDHLGLTPGMRVLDLGCGPGLYATRLARRGLHVTGVDISGHSLEYARRYARDHNLQIEYVESDFLQLEYANEFDVVLQIFGEVVTLSPEQRDRLLRNTRQALKPGGRLVFDVSTPHLREKEAIGDNWYVSKGGFWRAGPHLVLERSFSYPDHLHLDQFIIIEESGTSTVIRTWYQDYTAETITDVLETRGFTVESLWGNLRGDPLDPGGDWIGVITRVDTEGA